MDKVKKIALILSIGQMIVGTTTAILALLYLFKIINIQIGIIIILVVISGLITMINAAVQVSRNK